MNLEQAGNALLSLDGEVGRVVLDAVDEIARLRAENLELRVVFDFAWRLRPMLGAKWDGESDPLELALRELRDEAARRVGQQSA
jgi:hypothetical protein